MVETVIKANQKSKSRSATGPRAGSGASGDASEFDEDGVAGQELSKVPSASVRALGRLIWKKEREKERDPNWVSRCFRRQLMSISSIVTICFDWSAPVGRYRRAQTS